MLSHVGPSVFERLSLRSCKSYSTTSVKFILFIFFNYSGHSILYEFEVCTIVTRHYCDLPSDRPDASSAHRHRTQLLHYYRLRSLSCTFRPVRYCSLSTTTSPDTHCVAGVDCFRGSLFKTVKISYSLLSNLFIWAQAAWVDLGVEVSFLSEPLSYGWDSSAQSVRRTAEEVSSRIFSLQF